MDQFSVSLNPRPRASLFKTGLDITSELFLSPRETLFTLLLRDDASDTKPGLEAKKVAYFRDSSPSGSDSDSVFDSAEQYPDSPNESAGDEDTLLEEKDADAKIEQSPIAHAGDGVKKMNEANEAVWGAPVGNWADEDYEDEHELPPATSLKPATTNIRETPVDNDLGRKTMNEAFNAVWGSPLTRWDEEEYDDVPEAITTVLASPTVKHIDEACAEKTICAEIEEEMGKASESAFHTKNSNLNISRNPIHQLPPTATSLVPTPENLEQAWARAMICREKPAAEPLYMATIRKEALKRLQPGADWRYDPVAGWQWISPHKVFPPGVKGQRLYARPAWLQVSALRIAESADSEVKLNTFRPVVVIG
ncbi:hypothetical protein RUND412_005973 [Rhizina undulata]